MSYCEGVWQQALPRRAAILDLPFNRELAAGTLPRETFQFYMLQDSLYLDGYSRALSLLSAKMSLRVRVPVSCRKRSHARSSTASSV